MIFKDPLVLAIIPLVVIWFIWLRKKRVEPAFIFPTDGIIGSLKWSFRAWLAGAIVYLRLIALILLLVALARPQESGESMKRKEGIAMMLSIDCSSTMLAEDLQLSPSGLVESIEDYGAKREKRINRIDAVKKIAGEFVRAEPESMIGVVAFAGYAYVICPPTFDQEWLISSIDRIRVGMIRDATDIGAGILAAADSLSAVKAKSRAIVLLTDGNNNFGKVPPLVAARTAKAFGVKIYTIGIVGKPRALYPVKDEQGRKTYKYVRIEIDEDVLRKVAQITGGEYYSVKDLDDLKTCYADIGKLEKTHLEQRERTESEDVFPVFLIWAIFVILSDIILSNTYLRRIP
jgi:Ca-activated chloride channel homolog